MVAGVRRVPIVILLRVFFPPVHVIGLIFALGAFIPVLHGPFLLAKRQAYHRNAQQNDQQQWLPRPHLLVSLNTARLKPPVERSRLLSSHVSPRLPLLFFLIDRLISRPLQFLVPFFFCFFFFPASDCYKLLSDFSKTRIKRLECRLQSPLQFKIKLQFKTKKLYATNFYLVIISIRHKRKKMKWQ